MGIEPQNDNFKPLNLDQELDHKDHENIKSSMPLEMLQETKQDSHQAQSKGTISGFELDSSPKHHDVDDTNSGLDTEAKNLSRSSSSSSSSSLSSSDSLKKLDCGPYDNPPQTPQWSMISNTPRAGSGHLSSELLPPNHPDHWNMFNISSKMKSPRIQTMSRPGGYDPNRIPSHVFSTKANTNTEWSVASNDSLFSITMGNNSFSRDHVLQLGDPPPPITTKPNELINEVNSNEGFSSNLTPVIETLPENDKKSTHDLEKEYGIEDKKPQEKLREIKTKPVQEMQTENQVQSGNNSSSNQGVGLSNSSSNLLDGKGSPEGNSTPNNAPRASDESANSASSFAFPLLVEVGKSASLKAIDEEKREEIQQQTPKSQTPKAAAVVAAEGKEEGGGGGFFSFFTNFPKCC